MSTAPMSEQREAEALRAVAQLFGGLLLREVDAAQLERLRAPRLRDALAAIGVELPAEQYETDWICERGAEYHDLLLSPKQGGPPVQSLWTEGRYEGDSTVRVRALAAAAGLEFDREPARGAAVDHIGSLMLLWAEATQRAPEVAARIASEHLRWAEVPLRAVAGAGGFYGALAGATLAWLAEVATDEH